MMTKILAQFAVIPGTGGCVTCMGAGWGVVQINKGTIFEAGKFLGMSAF